MELVQRKLDEVEKCCLSMTFQIFSKTQQLMSSSGQWPCAQRSSSANSVDVEHFYDILSCNFCQQFTITLIFTITFPKVVFYFQNLTYLRKVTW